VGVELTKSKDETTARWLVYTSAGDRSNVLQWLSADRKYDLWVTYYGDANPQLLRDGADYFNVRKGSKFQNLHHAYQCWSEILQRYSAILVMDDDIIIDPAGLERLFALRELHDYWIVQPAYSARGKISHPITFVRRGIERRETNFIEMTCPLFRRDVLDEFMGIFDPRLTGWGTDWLYLDMLGERIEGHVAIIDAVACVNPRDEVKGGREIVRLQGTDERRATWQKVKAERGISIDEERFIEYSQFRIASPAGRLLRLINPFEGWLVFTAVPIARGLRRRVRSAIREAKRRIMKP
jgi:hypothetical protein